MAVSSDNGMAVAEMMAVRTLNKNRNSTVMTKIDPMRMSVRTPWIATSIKLAGLNKPSCKVTFCALSAGLIS